MRSVIVWSAITLLQHARLHLGDSDLAAGDTLDSLSMDLTTSGEAVQWEHRKQCQCKECRGIIDGMERVSRTYA